MHKYKNAMAESLDRAVNNAFESRDIEPKYRVFKNNGLDYLCCRKLPELWVNGEQSSYEQLDYHFGVSTYLAINDIAKWDVGLCSEIRRALESKSILDRFCNPRIVDTYTFVSSSSGWTPFGAHVDFEHSIIIGVSGEPRTIYVWEPNTDIGQLMPNASTFYGLSFDYERHLKTARKLVVGPGDICVIRRLEGHVFYATGGGMFVGLSCIEADGECVPDTYSHVLTPTRDPMILEYLEENNYGKLFWSEKALVFSDRVEIGEQSINLDESQSRIAKELMSSIIDSKGINFRTCLTQFQGAPIDVKSLVCSCVRAGAINIA